MCLADSELKNEGEQALEVARKEVQAKDYDRAFDHFVDADIWFQKKRLSEQNWQPAVAQGIKECEEAIVALLKLDWHIQRVGDQQSQYVTAWLEIENGYQLMDKKEYRDALARFKDGYVRMNELSRLDPDVDMSGKSRSACVKELLTLPEFIARYPEPGK